MDNLKPGGWVEMVEVATKVFADDDSLDKAPNAVRWGELQTEASGAFGKQSLIAPDLKKWMTDAGFINVKEEVFKVCLSSIFMPD